MTNLVFRGMCLVHGQLPAVIRVLARRRHTAGRSPKPLMSLPLVQLQNFALTAPAIISFGFCSVSVEWLSMDKAA